MFQITYGIYIHGLSEIQLYNISPKQSIIRKINLQQLSPTQTLRHHLPCTSQPPAIMQYEAK